jgi:hypothetical protein
MKLLSKPASWLRAGATLTPEFIGRNPIRDQFAAFVYSKYGFLPGIDLVRGIFSMAKKDDMYWDWKKGGGDNSMLVSMDRNYLQDNLGELISKYPVLNRIKNPMEALRILSELGEAGTRIGEFRKGIQAEGDTKEGMQTAALASREVTLDFAKKGTVAKSYNMITAFWSAQVNGVDKMVRSFKDEPLKTTLKTVAAITLPSVLLAIATHDDKRIKDLDAWQRDLFWIIPTENHLWRIPKPFELGILFGSVPERIVHSILDKDPHAFDGILKSAWEGLTPGMVPTAGIPAIEAYANRSLFTDRAIVPEARTGLLPQYQYGAQTTDTAKALAKVMGRLPWLDDSALAKPAQVENIIRGWTGGMGMYALNLLDKGAALTGITDQKPPEPTGSLSDIPFVKAFHVRYPSSSGANIQRFYDNYKQVDAEVKTFKFLVEKEGRPEEAFRVMNSSSMMQLNGMHKALGNMHNLIDQVYKNPDMTPDEKREFIDTSYLQMQQLAIASNTLYDDVKNMMKEREKEVKESYRTSADPQFSTGKKPDQPSQITPVFY